MSFENNDGSATGRAKDLDLSEVRALLLDKGMKKVYQRYGPLGMIGYAMGFSTLNQFLWTAAMNEGEGVSKEFKFYTAGKPKFFKDAMAKGISIKVIVLIEPIEEEDDG